MRSHAMQLICAGVLATAVTLSEAKPSYESSQSMKSPYKTNYPPHMGEISEERYLPLIYGHPLVSHYPLPLGYNPDLEDFSVRGYDEKPMKPHGAHRKHKRKSSKHHLGPKYDYGCKKRYPWSKYETKLKSHYLPRTFERDFAGESNPTYRSHLFGHDSKTGYPASAYRDHVYGYQQVAPREHVNIFITPPTKKKTKKVPPQPRSSDEGYKTSPSYRYPWAPGQCPSSPSYGRVYRSPVSGYDDAAGLGASPLVEYDPSAETSLQLYRRALYGASSSSSSSSSLLSGESAPYGGRRSYYPKRSPQHPEEFLASLTKSNNGTSSTLLPAPTSQQQQQQQQQQQEVGDADTGNGGPAESASSSEDTLAYINRMLAAQSQSRRSQGSQDGDKPDANVSEDLRPDYSIFGEGYSDPTSGYRDSELDAGDVGGRNATVQATTSKEDSDSSSASS